MTDIAMGLDPELFDRWVAALRSGKYQQGKGQLRVTRGPRAGYVRQS